MNQSPTSLIESLVDDLKAVRPLKRRNGALLTLTALVLTIAGVGLLIGFRQELQTGQVAPLFIIGEGLLLLLGLAAGSAVIAMSNPQVGSRHEGASWAMATLSLLPAAAILATLTRGTHGAPLLSGYIDLHCMILSIGCSALVAVTLFFWLRRGAPVSLARAGLYLGVASGALGSFAYGLSCPLETVQHLGLWHVLPVALLGLLGHLVIPHLLRW
jgi:hypothetical protein